MAKTTEPEPVTPFERLEAAIAIFAVPSKETPAIVLAVCKAVAVAAFPVVFWLRVGKSPATAIVKAPVPVVDFKIPVAKADVPAE